MIEVGEYIRTQKGEIGKIIKIKNDDEYSYDYYVCDNDSATSFKMQIVKHSPNLIDLIEDEDIVILEYKTPKYRERIERKFIVCKIDDFINFENRNCNFTYKVGDKKIVDKICKNIKIKGILTTEQFNNEYYRLEE